MADPDITSVLQEADDEMPAVPEAPGGVSVHPVAFTPLEAGTQPDGALSLDLILDVEVPVVVELGRSEMPLQELLALKPGSLLELDRLAGEPADLVIRGHVVAQGEIIVVDDSFGIRITNIVDPSERVRHLR